MKDYLLDAAKRLFRAFRAYMDRLLTALGRHVAHGILSWAIQARAYAARRLKRLADAVNVRLGGTDDRGGRRRAGRER